MKLKLLLLGSGILAQESLPSGSLSPEVLAALQSLTPEQLAAISKLKSSFLENIFYFKVLEVVPSKLHLFPKSQLLN